MTESWFVPLTIFLMAWLYSAVGHGGGSGYLAALALLGVAASVMRPTALLLNLLVAGIATLQFARSGYFQWRAFWPFALASVPLAFLGGRVQLSGQVYKKLVAAALIFAAVKLIYAARRSNNGEVKLPPVPVALSVGGVLGFVAGLTGVGGGIFLSPLFLLFGWADTRQTAAVSAAFIWVNSAAGLAGQTAQLAALPRSVGLWALAAGAGGALGSELGRKSLGSVTLRRLLALVLLIAGAKLLLT